MTEPSSKSHRQVTPRAPVRRTAPVVRQALWASVPVWSIGFLSFVPFLAYALIRRRKADWGVFAVYFAATIGLTSSGSSPAPMSCAPTPNFHRTGWMSSAI
jgi:hypothetical protein